MNEMKTLRERDAELDELWKQLEDLPMDPDTEKTEEPFLSFPAGTDREEIWHWFDERHSKGISYLLYGTPFYEKNDDGAHSLLEVVYPLLGLVKQEVPFRLKEIFHIPDDLLTPSVIDDIVWSLYYDSDVMFDYDSMDEFIRRRLEKFDINPDDYECK